MVTGIIKANFPVRVAYQVCSGTDSRVILDMVGAEDLIGRGDMLLIPPGSSMPLRMQSPFISSGEIASILKGLSRTPRNPYLLPEPTRIGTEIVGDLELIQSAIVPSYDRRANEPCAKKIEVCTFGFPAMNYAYGKMSPVAIVPLEIFNTIKRDRIREVRRRCKDLNDPKDGFYAVRLTNDVCLNVYL